MTSPSTSSPAVLLVDDDPNFLLSSSVTLRAEGIRTVRTLEDSRETLSLLEKTDVAAVVLDLTMPHLSGTELLPRIRKEYPGIPVIVLTGRDEVEPAVTSMKAGAFDYLVKPVEPARLVGVIRHALKMRELQDEVSSLRDRLLSSRLEHEEAFSGIVTRSQKMIAIFRYLEAVGRSTNPLLIMGETGSGKELIAEAVHAVSGRRGRFIAVNTSGLEDNVFSDTLFGHRKGAFTGADQPREGLIAQAAGGTLFLDEIGDMTDASQVKLLRLLEEHLYYPLGSDTPRKSEARVVCATHHNLKERSATGTFRKDLYYRLSTHQVTVPPLRERKEDLPLLVDHLLGEAAASLGKKKPTPPRELDLLLSNYPFHGNIRELKSMIYEAVLRHSRGVLSLEHFRNAVGEHIRDTDWAVEEPSVPFPLGDRMPTLKEAEEFLVEEALRRSGNNQGIAASFLGITRQALNKRLSRARDGSKPR